MNAYSNGADTSPEAPRTGLRRVSMSQWILIAMILGVIIGWMFPEADRSAHNWAATDLAILSNVFLRMIKSLIVPLLFSTLVVGIAGHGDDMKRVGRLAFRSILYFEIVTTLALVVGLAAVNIVKPGRGIDITNASAEQGTTLAATKTTVSGLLEHTVPQSFFQAAAENQVLQIVFWTIIFAVGLSRVSNGPAKKFMLSFCESLSEVMFKFVGVVMTFAPIGIGPWLIAFSSASSEAALPLAMERMEQMGVPRRIVAFVLPTGYSFNLDGTTLYLSLASVFVAQAAGIDMPLSTQLYMMLTLMLTSKGVAAVPRASLVILSGTLVQFGLPLQAVGVILGVDALMDMARTSTNVLGNCLATVVMAKWEGDFDTGVSPPAMDAMAGQSLSVPRVGTPT